MRFRARTSSHILVQTEAEAQTILDAARRRAPSFATLAEQKSTDTGSGATGRQARLPRAGRVRRGVPVGGRDALRSTRPSDR